MDRYRRAFFLGGLVIALLLGSASASRAESSSDKPVDPSVRPEFSEPVVLASKDGVLEVRLTAQQGEARLDTVAEPGQELPRLRL